MPLPLVPVLILAATVVAAGKGTYDTINASQRIKTAKLRYERRRKKYKLVHSNLNQKRKKVQKSFEELRKVRLESLIVLGEVADVLKKAKVKERNLEDKLSISKKTLNLWKTQSIKATEIMGGIIKAGVTGVSTASAAYGLAGLLGISSTGTAIGTLSGAAAKSATLAWLGGGALAAGGGGVALGTAVLGGLVAGPSLLVTGFFAKGQARKFETELSKKIYKIEISEAKINKHIKELDLILKRISEVKRSTNKIRKKVEELLKKTTSSSTLEDLYFLYKTAKSLSELRYVDILDKKRKLSK